MDGTAAGQFLVGRVHGDRVVTHVVGLRVQRQRAGSVVPVGEAREVGQFGDEQSEHVAVRVGSVQLDLL